MRPTWNSYFMEIANLVCKRSTCPRRNVGAVLVQNNEIRATGYNGAPPGATDCLEGDCLMRDGSCVRTNHAEANVILFSDRYERKNSTLYTTDRPCLACANLIVASGINTVYYQDTYWRDDILVSSLFADNYIYMQQFNEYKP